MRVSFKIIEAIKEYYETFSNIYLCLTFVLLTIVELLSLQ